MEKNISISQIEDGFNIKFMHVIAYFLSYENREPDMVWGTIVISLSVICIVSSLFLNILVFSFYLKKSKKDIISMIYTLLAGFDIFVSLGGLLMVVSMILYLSIDMEHIPREYVIPSMAGFCIASFVTSSIAIRMSIVLNAVLCLARTVMIKNPFARISKKAVLIVISAIFIFWTLLTVGDVFAIRDINIGTDWNQAFESREANNVTIDEYISSTPKMYLYLWYFVFNSMAGYYHVIEFLSTTLPWSSELWPHDSHHIETAEMIVPYVMFVLAYLIATFVAIICLVIQAIHLKKSEFSSENNRQVTITIVILTSIFVFCNTVSIVFISIVVETWEQQYSEDGSLIKTVSKDSSKIQRFYRGMFIFQQMVPLLNAALNPMVLICRGSKLKEYSSMKRLLQKC